MTTDRKETDTERAARARASLIEEIKAKATVEAIEQPHGSIRVSFRLGGQDFGTCDFMPDHWRDIIDNPR